MSTDAELLARYSPYVQYDSLESYAADSVATMTDCVPSGFPRGNTLRRWWRRVLAMADTPAGGSKLEPGFLRGDRYPDARGKRVSKRDYIDAVGKNYVEDAREIHARPGYANHVYGAARRDTEDSLWLQYWFFYYYNDKGLLGSGLHEGDWEMVQLRIGAGEEPDVATYSQHTYAERCKWSEVEKEDGPEGPVAVVYSGRGSHASYFRPGSHSAPFVPDHNDDEGPRVRPQLDVIEAGSPRWVAWPGRWGSTRHLLRTPFGDYGADSPPGPRWHDAWDNPLTFHEKAHPAKELGPVAGAEQPRPAEPEIEVRREGSQAIVSYGFPEPDPAAPKPKAVLLSLDGHKDGRPPATYSFEVGEGPGEIRLPLELADRVYTVRAAAVGENDVPSPAASVELPAKAGPS